MDNAKTHKKRVLGILLIFLFALKTYFLQILVSMKIKYGVIRVCLCYSRQGDLHAPSLSVPFVVGVGRKSEPEEPAIFSLITKFPIFFISKLFLLKQGF